MSKQATLEREGVVDRSESQVAPVTATAPLLAPAHRREPLPPPAGDMNIVTLMDRAIQSGANPKDLTDLYSLFEKMEDRRRAQDFARAMAEFQAECPSIPKSSTAKIVTTGGSSYSYSYAELDQIALTTRAFLHKHGLSYSWDSSETEGKLTCTCTVRHSSGHSERATFTCPTDAAAKMSGAQRMASALTYARRQSLIQALGLTTCDPDNDAGRPPSNDPITEAQAADIALLLDETRADRAKFLKVFRADRVEGIRASDYQQALEMLREKKRRMA